jgi:hypothetical protein
MDYNMILYILLMILSVEATTNIVSKSELFKPIRKYLFNLSKYRAIKFLHDLIDCPYCTSVWVSLFHVCTLVLVSIFGGIDIFILFMCVLSLHRLSNILHHLIDRINRNYGE